MKVLSIIERVKAKGDEDYKRIQEEKIEPFLETHNEALLLEGLEEIVNVYIRVNGSVRGLEQRRRYNDE